MVQIIARGSKAGIVNLYVRVFKRGVMNNAMSLGLSLPEDDWRMTDAVLRRAADAQKSGGVVTVRDTLALHLLEIRNGLEVMLEDGKLSRESAKRYVNGVLREYLRHDAAEASLAAAEPQHAEKKTLKVFIKEFIHQCETGERLKQRSSRMITAGTVKSYKGTLSQLEEYEQKRHKVIDFDDVTLDFYDDWRQFFLKKNYSPNTIGRHVRNLKIFLYAADEMKLTTCQEFKSARFSADREDVDNVYITKERLQEMVLLDMSSYQSMKERAVRFAKDEKERDSVVHALKRDIYRKNLAEARDIFVLGCLTGQRVSDYKRISSKMVETLVEGRDFLHIVQLKTGKDVYVPYSDMMKTILDRYDGELPKIQEQYLNERIKVVGLLLGWTEPAGLEERRGTLRYQSKKRFCDAIKTHTARRTFATNAYKAGVSLSSIMAVTGHSSEQMLRRYLKLDNKERAILAAKELERVIV